VKRDSDLWLATYGGGVSRLSGGRFTQYSTKEGLSSDLVWCLFGDRDGTLWSGTDGGGLNAFRQGRFTADARRTIVSIRGLVRSELYSQEGDAAHFFGSGTGNRTPI
jgi:hypothetical protein